MRLPAIAPPEEMHIFEGVLPLSPHAVPIASRYVGACLAVAAAFLLRIALSGYLAPPFVTFYPAVVLVALLAGLGPALVATALSAALAALWILPALSERPPRTTSDAIGLAFFVLMCALISALAELHRMTRDGLAQREKALALGEAGERTAAALRESEARLGAISGTVPDPVFLKDRESRVLLANPATLRAIGKPADQVLGRTDREFYDDPEVGATILATDRRIMESGVPEVVEERIQTPEGYRIFLSTKAPHRDAEGRVVGLVGIARDITERKEAEDQLREANARLAEADRRKTEFIGVLSHELRNPLAAIRSSVYVLHRAPAGGREATSARHIIQRQLEHLTRIVDDLLDVTRIARGRIELRRARVDLREVAGRSCEDHRALFEQAGVELRQDLADSPAWVDADAMRIAQVIGNLLQNAAKFTPAGGAVTVQVALCGAVAEVRVRDTGIGMGAEELERLLEPFTQADQGLARTQGGLGLGLALSKGLVELHGGSLSARSEGPGRGSEFCVALPLAPAPVARAAAPAPRGAGRGHLVLLIEDNVDTCESLSVALGLTGHRVRAAYDGRTGIAAAHELKPDVVLCDIGLPDIDGYEVARALRADAALRSTRLIALSGYARPEDKERSRQAGFDAHVSKPPELDDLNEVLGRVL
jgi:PAS domain S-box-containing protein